MKGKVVLISVGAIGTGILFNKIRNGLIDKLEKRDFKIKEEWHTKGWEGGYEAGKFDAKIQAFCESFDEED